MKFYLIKNIDSDTINGVVIESDEGLVHARLAGDKGTDDPKRVLPSLLQRMPSRGYPLEGLKGTSRIVSFVKPGQSGFIERWLRQLKPPLKLVHRGTVPPGKIDTPQAMTLDLWETFANGDLPPADERIKLPRRK